MDVEELSSLLADEKWHVERAKGFFFAADHGRSLRLLQHSGGTTQISMAPAGTDKTGLVLLSAHPYFDEQALSTALDLLRRD
jgi:hypothetical protein